MKHFTRLLMFFLSHAPIATVAIAAQAKAFEIDGQAQDKRILNRSVGARFRLLRPFQMVASIREAKFRYASVTGLQGSDLENAMKKDIRLLREKGLLQIDEKFIVSAGPSEHASIKN